MILLTGAKKRRKKDNIVTDETSGVTVHQQHSRGCEQQRQFLQGFCETSVTLLKGQTALPSETDKDAWTCKVFCFSDGEWNSSSGTKAPVLLHMYNWPRRPSSIHSIFSPLWLAQCRLKATNLQFIQSSHVSDWLNVGLRTGHKGPFDGTACWTVPNRRSKKHFFIRDFRFKQTRQALWMRSAWRSVRQMTFFRFMEAISNSRSGIILQKDKQTQQWMQMFTTSTSWSHKSRKPKIYLKSITV